MGVGNKAFVDEFVSTAAAAGLSPGAWRVVHYHDPVPRMAPKGLPFGYAHVPQEIYYYSKDESAYRMCDASGEDPSCGNSVHLWACLNDQHATYLNKTFKHTLRSPKCMDTPMRDSNFSRLDHSTKLV